MSDLIEVSHLTRDYGAFKLDDVSLTVPGGSILGLIGENGAGKSTTLKCILGLVRPDGGTVRLLGGDPADRDIREQVGDDELRIYQVALGEQETETGTKTGAEVLAVAYDQALFGTVSSWVLGDMTLENQGGTQTAWCGCDTLLNPDPRILFIRGFVETAPGDTYVTLSQDRFGQSFSLQIPLPEEVTP